jgi:hypothetical protein
MRISLPVMAGKSGQNSNFRVFSYSQVFSSSVCTHQQEAKPAYDCVCSHTGADICVYSFYLFSCVLSFHVFSIFEVFLVLHRQGYAYPISVSPIMLLHSRTSWQYSTKNLEIWNNENNQKLRTPTGACVYHHIFTYPNVCRFCLG